MSDAIDDKLMIHTSPGGISWSRTAAGVYSYRSFVLGGCGGGEHTAQQVAETIYRCAGSKMSTMTQELIKRGWDDVLTALKGLEQEKKAAQIGELKAKADDLREFAKHHQGKDYGHFRKIAYDQLRGPNGEEPDENDVSVRRLHEAACAMMSSVERAETIDKQIATLVETPPDSK